MLERIKISPFSKRSSLVYRNLFSVTDRVSFSGSASLASFASAKISLFYEEYLLIVKKKKKSVHVCVCVILFRINISLHRARRVELLFRIIRIAAISILIASNKESD